MLNEKSHRWGEYVGWALGASAAIGLAIWIATNVRRLGFRFETQTPVEQDYILAVLWWLILAVGILLLAGDAKRKLLVVWGAKFFIVLVAMLIYEHGYGLDAMDYQLTAKTGDYPLYPGVDFRQESKIPSTTAMTSADGRPMGGIGTENFIRMLMTVSMITGPYYHALKVVFAFFGLLGVWYFYRAIVALLGYEYPTAFYFLAFFPSVLFWSSILGKDPLQFLFLGLYAYGVANLMTRGIREAFWPLACGLMGSFLLRPWICAMALGALAFALLVGGKTKWKAVALIAGSLVVFVIFEDTIIARFNLQTGAGDLATSISAEFLVDALETSARGVAQVTQSSGGSGAAELAELASGGVSQVSLPWAVFSGLFRPLPFDVTNVATAMAAVENVLVFALAIVALLRLNSQILFSRVILWTMSFCLVWAVVYGFVVMANFGSGARYKLQMWPFLLMTLFFALSRRGREAVVFHGDPGKAKS